MVFHEHLELPSFAAVDLMKSEQGIAALRRYYRRYLNIAEHSGLGFILCSPTWRASPDWASVLEMSQADLARANKGAVKLMLDLRSEMASASGPILASGVIGPRGDGYQPHNKMNVEQAREYHSWQMGIFAEAGVDMAEALTMNYVEEAVGVARAGAEAGLPTVISFTVETDGRLPSGQSLGDAITVVDEQTQGSVAYFMINCAHPSHFEQVLLGSETWVSRVRGIRANASRLSHAELDQAQDLDDGDPAELASEYQRLHSYLPQLTVLGGCCGTDHRHVEAIAHRCGEAA